MCGPYLVREPMWQRGSVHISINTSISEMQLANRLKFNPPKSHTRSSMSGASLFSPHIGNSELVAVFQTYQAPPMSLPSSMLWNPSPIPALPSKLLRYHTSLKFSFVLFSSLLGFKECPHLMLPKHLGQLLLSYYLLYCPETVPLLQWVSQRPNYLYHPQKMYGLTCIFL